DVIPVADQSGVQLAAHPDDPPMPTIRGQPRLVYQPHMYQRLLDLVPSRCNALELCVGTLAEMTEGDVYDAVDSYSRQGKIAYLHLRNVTGKVPHYRETFIDEGDLDMIRILSILKRNNFDGVIIPDHTPQMSCAAPWHAGMAHTLGFILAVKAMLESSNLHQFVAWRLIGGLGIGAASVISPNYIAEIAPTRVRGRCVTLYQLGIVVGILAAVFANMLIQRMGDEAWNTSAGWRWMFFAG